MEDVMGAPLTTPLARRDPLYAMTPLSLLQPASFFDEFFNDFLARPMLPTGYLPGSLPEVSPVKRARMDVVDRGGMFLVKVDLPGVNKEDIVIDIEGARVSISANVVTQTPVKEGEKLLYTERVARSHARSFELPAEVTEEGADARFEDGVLTLALPKRAAVMSKRLTIR
jgi:HSP20 family protein